MGDLAPARRRRNRAESSSKTEKIETGGWRYCDRVDGHSQTTYDAEQSGRDAVMPFQVGAVRVLHEWPPAEIAGAETKMRSSHVHAKA